jgi:hypothetical protein
MFSATKSLTKKAQSILTVTAAAGLLALIALPGQAGASNSPFVGMSGTWSGGGTITMASGAKERIRCRAKYDVNGSGSALDLTLRCASDSYKFELQSNVAHNNGAVSGNWAELTHRVGGTLSGSAKGNHIQVRVEGTLSAMLALSTNANQQSISIQAPGAEMRAVAISLSRGSK